MTTKIKMMTSTLAKESTKAPRRIKNMTVTKKK